jgi:uncharacterized protein
MMAGGIVRLRTTACVMVLAAGCASAPARFYILESTAGMARGDAPLAPLAVIVGPVSVPASVDRPEFVVQVAPNRVEVDEFNRWAAPLGDGIARAVAVDLTALLGTPNVATAPLANFDATHRVTIDVQRFDSMPGESTALDAVWVVRRSDGGGAKSGRTVARETVSGDGFEALAAAHSRAVERLAADIAAAIRSSPVAAR